MASDMDTDTDTDSKVSPAPTDMDPKVFTTLQSCYPHGFPGLSLRAHPIPQGRYPYPLALYPQPGRYTCYSNSGPSAPAGAVGLHQEGDMKFMCLPTLGTCPTWRPGMCTFPIKTEPLDIKAENTFPHGIKQEQLRMVKTERVEDEGGIGLGAYPGILSPRTSHSLDSKPFNLGMGAAPAVNRGVLRAARTMFSKRTMTLCHWLYPDSSKRRIKATVSSAWDTLPQHEKDVYIAQVLGRFGNQSTALMVNPQLDGITRYAHEMSMDERKTKTNCTKECTSTSMSMATAVSQGTQTKREVNMMLAEYDNRDCWSYYPRREECPEGAGLGGGGGGGGVAARMRWRTVCTKKRGPNAMLAHRIGTGMTSPLHLPDPHSKPCYEEDDSTDEDGQDIWKRSADMKAFMHHYGI